MMPVRLFFLIYFLFISAKIFAGDTGNNFSLSTVNTVVTESNLPIIKIYTHGIPIADNPKMIADMEIIDNGLGNRNHLSDAPNEYDGKIGIEYHGSHSQWYPKKSYSFETMSNSGNSKMDVSIFGMPEEHDWILNAAYADKSLMRDVLTYQLSRELDHYAAQTKYVDLFIDGQYQGVYIFMEKIKRDHGRIDIANLRPNEVTPPDVTGGYVIKIDKLTGNGGAGWHSAYPPVDHSMGQVIYFQYDYPSTDSIVPAQEIYIRSYVDSFENALAGPDFMSSINGYSRFIGKGSWIDYFFINELSKNLDAYRISTYLYKDKDKTLKTGPVWDYDIAWGNADVCNANDTTGWSYMFQCPGDGFQVPFWWQRLMQDTNYTNQMKCRWINYRQNILSESHINAIIDSVGNLLNESQGWNFSEWPILGQYVWPNPVPQPSAYADHLQNLKNWVSTRLDWLDANMPGNCNCSLNAIAQNVSCNSLCDGLAIALGNSPYEKNYLWSNGVDDDTIIALCPGTFHLEMEDAIGCRRSMNVNVNEPAQIVINSNITNSTCTGGGCNGSAIVNATGGNAPYNYTWSNGQFGNQATALCRGTYNVTVTDNNSCSKSFPIIIQNPLAPVVNVSTVTNASCNGFSDGAASINVSGGTPPYSYSWFPSGNTSPNATGLAAGNHTVTVFDAGGCSSQIVINISQASSTVVHSTVNNPVCHGGTGNISVNATGGISPYTFLWSPGGNTGQVLNSVTAGVYLVIVTDGHGCTTTQSITVTEPAPINLSVATNSPECFGGTDGSASVSVTGGSGTLNYFWLPTGQSTPSVNQLSAGNYSVAVEDNFNCIATASVTISNPPPINLSTSVTMTTCNSNNGTATVVASSGTSPYTYNWFPSGSNNSTATNLSAGDQIISVTDAEGCTNSDTVTIVSASGLSVSYTGQPNVTCHGGNDAFVNLDVSGGASPYSYLWTPGGNTGSFNSNLSPGLYTVTISDQNGCVTDYLLNISEPDPVSITLNPGTALCYNTSTGSLRAIPSGGVEPYTYLWTPGISTLQTANNLFPGNYSVRVTDSHGCSATASSTVTNPTDLNLSVNIMDASCGHSNGRAEAIASGGTGTYHYSWSTGDTGIVNENLPAGNYSVIVTDQNACSHTTVFTINGTPGPVVSVSNFQAVTCHGGSDGSVALLSSGTTGPVSYHWFPSVSTGANANNLFSGLYNVVVTDTNNCTDSIGFILPEPAPVAALMVSENIKCFGDSNGKLFADAGGGTSPYSFLWDNGQTSDTATGLTVGLHSLIITDSHGCTATASGVITQPDSISLQFSVSHATCQSCSDGKVHAIVEGGIPPYSYRWFPSNSTTDSISDLITGYYTLCVTDGNHCEKCDSVKVKVGVIGVEEISRNSSLYVYPNPLSNYTIFVFALSSRQKVSLEIYNSTGELIDILVNDEMDEGDHYIRFNASALSPGIYFYHFSNIDRFQSGTLIIQR